MQATIKNYRGIQAAVLDISRICLLAGTNEAGKTSAAQALAAALTGEAIPIPGVKKTSAGLLVRSGTASGSIDLVSEAGSAHVAWPTAKVKTEGQAPYASHFAAGLQSIATIDEKDRPKVLAEYLHAVPTRDDLDAQLKDMNLPVAVLDQLWKLIETQGWDNAHAQIKDKGARLKGQWENVTADRYGTKKAENWIPDGYEQDLMGMSEDTLKAVITDARDALEATIAADAVDESRKVDLERLVSLLPGRRIDLQAAEHATIDPALKSQLEEGNGFVASISEKRDAIALELRNLPSAEQAAGQPCPECGTVLTVIQGDLAKVTVMPEEEIAARATALEEATKRLDAVNRLIQQHMESTAKIKSSIQSAEQARTDKIRECKRLVAEADQAERELQGMEAAPTGQASDIAYIEQCRVTLARAESRLKAFTQKREADRLHTAIGQNQALIAKISPEGIRGDVLAKALTGFNEKMTPLCAAAGWRDVALEPDFSPTYGGTPYMLLSESAKFRVRTMLALAMAAMDRSQAVIIDAADILDKGGRNGLFKALKLAGLSALVTMTMDAKELVPNLGKAKLGASYWINGDAVAEALT